MPGPQANEGPFRGKVRDEVMAEDCEAVSGHPALPGPSHICTDEPHELTSAPGRRRRHRRRPQVAMAADRVRRELELAFEPLLLAHTRVGALPPRRPCLSSSRSCCVRTPCCDHPHHPVPLQLLTPPPAFWAQAGEPAKLKPSIIYDSANNALWLRIPKNAG